MYVTYSAAYCICIYWQKRIARVNILIDIFHTSIYKGVLKVNCSTLLHADNNHQSLEYLTTYLSNLLYVIYLQS